MNTEEKKQLIAHLNDFEKQVRTAQEELEQELEAIQLVRQRALAQVESIVYTPPHYEYTPCSTDETS